MTTESTRGRSRALCAAAAAALAAVTYAHVAAQTPASPTFEVATIKRNTSREGFVRLGLQPGGRFTAQNVPLVELIRLAYTVQPYQVEGGPGWMRVDRFDVTAKAESDIPSARLGELGPLQLMLQNLLAERFNLKVRRETKEMPIYELVLARSDGAPGPKLEPATVDCEARTRGRGAGGPPAPPRPGQRPECGAFMGPASMAVGSATMDQFAQMLSARVGRQVLNKTGLAGNYGFTLDFAPDQMPPAALNGAPAPVDPDAPSIFTALQEQLGLKLDARRGQVDTLVIESVSQPTPD